MGAKVRSERGLTSTELAVVMPVLIALVLVPFQVALWWHARQVADAAATEAVDAAQVAAANEADGVRAAEWLLDAAGNLVSPASSSQLPWPPGRSSSSRCDPTPRRSPTTCRRPHPDPERTSEE